MVFDGVNDSAQFDETVDLNGEMTVSAWVRPEQAPAGLGRVVVNTYAYNGGGTNQRGWLLGNSYGSIDRFRFRINGENGVTASAEMSGFFAQYLNQWVHVTGVFKPGEAVRLYVNGQLMAEDTTNVPDAIGQTGLFKIGARSDNTTQGFWDGQIDDLRITGRALNASEIQSLSSRPVTAVTRRSTYSIAGQPVAVRVTGDPEAANNGLFYIHSDHLGSTSVLTKYSDGYIVSSSLTRYTPFGGYRSGGPNPLTDRAFTGQKENMALGLYYYNARYYAPSLGRFLSADTLVPDPQNPQQFNRYAYSLNSPVRYIDPTGHCVLGLPCPKPIQDGITTVSDFSAGVIIEVAYNNSLGLATDLAPSTGEPIAMTVGRVAGDLVTMTQGGGEMAGGSSLMGGGALVCLTGVGCATTPAAEATGLALVGHGLVVTTQGAGQLIENGGALLSKGTFNSSNDQNPRNFKRLSKGEIKLLTESGHHPHDLKPRKSGSKFDIFKDENGDLYVMPKDGSGPGDPLGININDLWD